MALNFDVSRVKDFERMTTHPDDLGKEQQRWHPVTDALIWKTMAVDLGEITEKNVDEWWFRVRFLQLLDGAELRGGIGSFFLTREDIVNHIGLSTNVTTKSRKYWLDRILQKDLPGNGQEKSAFELINEGMAKYNAEQAAKAAESATAE